MDAALPLSINGTVTLGAELRGLCVGEGLVVEGRQQVAVFGIVAGDAAGIDTVLQFDISVLVQVGGVRLTIDADVAIHASALETVDHRLGGIGERGETRRRIDVFWRNRSGARDGDAVACGQEEKNCGEGKENERQTP